MSNEPPFDIVVYGATGFTGRLVAEYLAERYPAASGLRWAMAGRSQSKLEAVRDEIGAPADTPLVVADAGDSASLDALVSSTRCVLTTVGPYTLYGSDLVAACAASGTDYLDLSGEVLWMNQMIEQHHAAAQKSGARIVHSAGFDSIPFDLGVFFLQNEAKKRLGGVCNQVRGRVRAMQGTMSGGTNASMKATMAAVKEDPSLFAKLVDPFSLSDGFKGPEQPDLNAVEEDAVSGGWIAPFFMAPINTKNVHRSNALLGHAYGEDFVYDEMFFTGPGEAGQKAAQAIVDQAAALSGGGGPKPGEGPSKEEREAGHYDVLFVGTRGDQTIRVGVTGDKDPGYGSTSKIIAEAAVCLIRDCPDTKGGVWTPAPAMGDALIPRLIQNAGLTFEVEG